MKFDQPHVAGAQQSGPSVKFIVNCQVLNAFKSENELDPVGSTVRYEMRKLCTGSV